MIPMKPTASHFLLAFTLLLCSFPRAFAQTQAPLLPYELYQLEGKQLTFQGLLRADNLQVIDEQLKFMQRQGHIFFLNAAFRPNLGLGPVTIDALQSPWILVRGTEGLGVWHRYGEQVLETKYATVETSETALLVRDTEGFAHYDRRTRHLSPIGNFDSAHLLPNGQVLATKSGQFYLPISNFLRDQPLDSVQAAGDNFLIFTLKEKKGLVNAIGKVVLPAQMDALTHLEKDFFLAREGKEYRLLKALPNGIQVQYVSYHRMQVDAGTPVEYIHGKLRRILKGEGILLDAVGMTRVEALAPKVYRVDFRDGKTGVYGASGWLLPPTSDIRGLSWLADGQLQGEWAGAKAFLSPSRQWIAVPEAIELRPFYEERAAVRFAAGWTYVDTRGERLPVQGLEAAGAFSKGVAAVGQGGSYFLIDKEGEVLSESFSALRRFADDLYLAEKEGKWGIWRADGSCLWPAELETAQLLEDQFLLLLREGHWGLADREGRMLLPFAYRQIEVNASSGMIAAQPLAEPDDAPLLSKHP
ncbi:MAG: WG repeat-containing protein [Nitritalea sp.]